MFSPWPLLLLNHALASTHDVDLQADSPTIKLNIDEIASGDIKLRFSGPVQRIERDGVACGPLDRNKVLSLRDSPCLKRQAPGDGAPFEALKVQVPDKIDPITVTMEHADTVERSTVFCSAPAEDGSEYAKACGLNGLRGANLFIREVDDSKNTVEWGAALLPGLDPGNLYVWLPWAETWARLADVPELDLDMKDISQPDGSARTALWLTIDSELFDSISAEPSKVQLRALPQDSSEREITWTLSENSELNVEKKDAPVPDVPATFDCSGYNSLDELSYLLLIDATQEPATDWVLCSRYKAGSKERGTLQPQLHTFVMPNRPVSVIVKTNAGRQATLSDAADADQALNSGVIVTDHFETEGLRSAAGIQNDGDGSLHHEFMLSPRKSGGYTITVAIKGSKGDAALADVFTQTFELFVLKKQVAAFRTGLGVSVPVGSPQQYEAIGIPGQTGQQIAATSVPVQPEVLVAFAPFVFSRGGRPHFPDRAELEGLNNNARRSAGDVLAPYIGFGVSPGDSAVFSSYHVGLDVDLGRGLSLQVGGFMRAEEQLHDSYSVGAAVDDGDDFSHSEGFYFGPAAFLSVTPWFFRQVPGAGLSDLGGTN